MPWTLIWAITRLESNRTNGKDVVARSSCGISGVNEINRLCNLIKNGIVSINILEKSGKMGSLPAILNL